jgi:hypothetical protein
LICWKIKSFIILTQKIFLCQNITKLINFIITPFNTNNYEGLQKFSLKVK